MEHADEETEDDENVVVVNPGDDEGEHADRDDGHQKRHLPSEPTTPESVRDERERKTERERERQRARQREREMKDTRNVIFRPNLQHQKV